MKERIANISHQIKTGWIGADWFTFDILLIEELWSVTQHNTIKTNLPPNYHMTGFKQLGDPNCWSGHWCSGLAIISRYPLSNVKFEMYGDKGWGDLLVGEIWAGKGFGQVTIHPTTEISVAVFVTHTVAKYWISQNNGVRERQMNQMMKHIDKSDADLIILGGDLNAEPWEKAVQIVKQHQMKSSKEYVLDETEWRNPKYATYGNPKNPHSSSAKPQFLDYVFYRSNSCTSKAIDFQVPSVGLSDHSPIWTKIRAVKYSIKYS